MHEMNQDDRKLAFGELEQFDARTPSVSDIPALSQLATHPYQWIRRNKSNGLKRPTFSLRLVHETRL